MTALGISLELLQSVAVLTTRDMLLQIISHSNMAVKLLKLVYLVLNAEVSMAFKKVAYN